MKPQRPDNRHDKIAQALAAIGLTIQAAQVGSRWVQRAIVTREAARRVA